MIQKPKGTRDLLPGEIETWQYIEEVAKEIFETYGLREIRVPVFEYTELFERGVGETTDVVQKEMYTFEDKGGRSITLRPEGTAGVLRAYIENGMGSKPSPLKVWYAMPMYRYENVQKGRYREFRQIGVEIIDTESYMADVELITMAKDLFETLNIQTQLHMNSIGCPTCRAHYQKVLKEFLANHIESYCETCQTRFEKNPMRILDCKEEKCKKLNQGAPVMIDYLCEECKKHFENVKQLLESSNIDFTVDSSIVRGLDYYTRTVFEFIDEKEGYTVLGGGRYDGLAEELDYKKTPALGFALGIDRLVEVFKRDNEDMQIYAEKPDLYIAQMGGKSNELATKLIREMREYNVYTEKDITEKSLKAQFKYADKIGARYVLTIGQQEVNEKQAILKEMETGKEQKVNLTSEEILEAIY